MIALAKSMQTLCEYLESRQHELPPDEYDRLSVIASALLLNGESLSAAARGICERLPHGEESVKLGSAYGALGSLLAETRVSVRRLLDDFKPKVHGQGEARLIIESIRSASRRHDAQ